jgi:hypothetical protein
MQVYGALRGIKRDQREDALYQQKSAGEQQYRTYLGNVQKDENYKPDTAAPDYNPEAWSKAVMQNIQTVTAAEEFQTKKAETAQKRIELQRQNIARSASDAMAIYQTDPQAGTIAMLKTYDHLHDGIDLVKDENGNPLIDEQGQITLKGLNGNSTKMPIPPMNDMVKMAQTYTDPKALQEVDSMSSKAYQAANASAIAKAKQYKGANGQVVAVVDRLYDPVDRSKTQTVILDLKTGQQISPSDFAQGGFREISHESTEKFEQQSALKGMAHQLDKAKLDYEYQLRGQLEDRKASATNKGGVGSAVAKRELELVLMPFAPANAPLFTMDGEFTQEGANAMQKAQVTLDKYRDAAPKTLTEKREASQAQRALQVYSAMYSQVVDKWGGNQGQAAQLRVPAGGQPGPVPGGQPAMQPQAPPAALQQIKAEYQQLASQYGKDSAKQMIIKKYPQAFGGQ